MALPNSVGLTLQFYGFCFSSTAILERLDNHYPPDNPDSTDVQQGISIFEAAMGSMADSSSSSASPLSSELDDNLSNVEQKIQNLENIARLMELQR